MWFIPFTVIKFAFYVYINYGAYGSGTKPRILGSLQGTSWTRHETAENIWICDNVDFVGMGGYIAQIFLAKESITQNRDSIIWGDINLSAQLSDLEYNYEWAPIGGEVYMYYKGDINADFKYVEVPQAANSIFINFQEYIAFDNLELAFTSFSGIRNAYGPRYLEGLKVTNCYIHHIGHKNSNTAYGTYTYHSDAYFALNEIHDCGRRSISLAMVEFGDGAVMKNIVVENN
jgi:hypothetical protein